MKQSDFHETAIKKSSIGKKLLLLVFIGFIVIIALVFAAFFIIVSGQMHNRLNAELLLKSQANADNINADITAYMTGFEGFIFDLENTTDRSLQTIRDALDKKVQTYPQGAVSAFYIGYGESNYIYETLGWIPDASYVVKDRPWYTDAISSPGLNIITYADANTGIYAICISSQIKTDTGEQAVLAIDLIISPAFEGAKMEGDTEYFFVEDAEGKIIYHPNADFMPFEDKVTMLPDACADYAALGALSAGSVVTINDYDGTECVFTVSEIENGDFRVYTGIRTSVVSNEIARILAIGIALAAGLLIIAFVAFAWITRRIILNPLRFASKYISDIARTGNLALAEAHSDENARYIRSGDEIADTLQAAKSLFEMMKGQVHMLERIAGKDLDHTVEFRSEHSTLDHIAARLIGELSGFMGNVQGSSAHVASFSKQIADSSQILAQGSMRQSEIGNCIVFMPRVIMVHRDRMGMPCDFAKIKRLREGSK